MKFILLFLFVISKKKFYTALFEKVRKNYIFRLLSRPSLWYRGGRKTDKEWDSLLNILLDHNDIEPFNSWSHCRIGEFFIWTGGYGGIYGDGNLNGTYPLVDFGLPSRKTIFKLDDAVEEAKIRLGENNKTRPYLLYEALSKMESLPRYNN